MKILLIGKPGSGKTTIARSLANSYNGLYISSGEILRNYSGTKYKKEVDNLLSTTSLDSKSIVLNLVLNKINSQNKEFIIFDGFPRNLKQANELGRHLEISRVIHLKTEDSIVFERLLNRYNCGCGNIVSNSVEKKKYCINCGQVRVRRKDDKEPLIKDRIRVFKQETLPLLNYYADVSTINVNRSLSLIINDIKRILKLE